MMARASANESANTSSTFDNIEAGLLTSTPSTSASLSSSFVSVQRMRGRKMVRKDRSAAYRKLKKLQDMLEKERRTKEKYRKQAQRLKKKNETAATPRSRAKKMLGKAKVSDNVRRALIFNNVLCATLHAKYAREKGDKDKFAFYKLLSSRCLKKYRLLGMCEASIGISRKRMAKVSRDESKVYRKTYSTKGFKARPDVVSFFERDDNSRITTSKKDTITRGGIKKQRRLLQDTMFNLHKKYCAERPLGKI
jgi:hypothetical protein